jgi:hypothetical protein
MGVWAPRAVELATTEEVLDDIVMASREGEPTNPRDWIGGGQCNREESEAGEGNRGQEEWQRSVGRGLGCGGTWWE